MNINISKIVDAGDIDKERVAFKVTEVEQLGGYLAFKTIQTEDGKSVSSKIIEPYWFPDRSVKRGDIVVLYTKKGINTEKKNIDETTTYFFYWNKETPMWKSQHDAILLMKIARWDAKSLAESVSGKTGEL